MPAPISFRIPILPFNIVNAHLIKTDGGCVLVDTGMPGSEKRIARTLSRHGLTFRNIKLIVVTRAHTDHAGSAARIRPLSGAPILAHKDDVDFYSRNATMSYCTTGRVGKLFIKTPAPHKPYEGFRPDFLMESAESVSLMPLGIDGVVRRIGRKRTCS